MTIKKEELEAIHMELMGQLNALMIAAKEGSIEKNEAFYRDQSLATELLRNVNEAIISFFKTPYWIWQDITDIQKTCKNSFHNPGLECYRSEYLFPFITAAVKERKATCSNAIASMIKIHMGEIEEVALSPFLLSFFKRNGDSQELQQKLFQIPLQEFCSILIQELLIDRATVHTQLSLALSKILSIHSRESDIYKEILKAKNALATPRHGPVEFIPSPRLMFAMRHAHSQPNTPHKTLISENELMSPLSQSMPSTPTQAFSMDPQLKKATSSDRVRSSIEEPDTIQSVLDLKSKPVVPSLALHFERLQIGGGKKTTETNNVPHTKEKKRKNMTKK